MGKDGFLAKKNGLFSLWQQKKARDNNVPKKTTPGHLFVLFKGFSDRVLFRRPFSGEYQDQVPTPIPEIKPMRAFWISLALCLVPGLSRADVVYSVTSASNLAINLTGSSSGFNNTVGQSFQNTPQSGNVESVTFKLRYANAAFTGGLLTIGIYNVAGTSNGYQPDGLVLATSQAINASSLTNTALDYTFSGFSAATLNASNVYMAVLQSSGLTGGDQIQVAGYNGIPSGTGYTGFNSATNGNGVSNQQLYGVITVPEPGTLLLASIAAACGGGGAWWRRKRQKASQVSATKSKC